MTTNRIYIKLTSIVWLLSSTLSFAVDIPVPVPLEIVTKSDIIAVVTFDSQQNSGIKATVSNILKGDADLLRKEIAVVSPYPEMSFPIKSWALESKNQPAILLGRWDAASKSIVLIYGPGSFWPRGYPTEDKTRNSIEECILFITHAIETMK